MPGYFVEEAGCICLDVSLHSSGLPWTAQLHSAQQTEGLSHQPASNGFEGEDMVWHGKI